MKKIERKFKVAIFFVIVICLYSFFIADYQTAIGKLQENRNFTINSNNENNIISNGNTKKTDKNKRTFQIQNEGYSKQNGLAPFFIIDLNTSIQ